MVIINGELVVETEAVVSLLDRNVQLGLNVFETLLAVKGRIDGFDLHVVRLKRGLDRLGIHLESMSEQSLEAEVQTLLDANQLCDVNARVRITAMGNNLLIQAEKAPERPNFCNAVISEYALNERSATAGIKCGSYADHILALRAADTDEVIFLNTVGEVAEAAMANVFIVNDGKLVTPRLASGCLPGVTRELIIQRVRAAGIEVNETMILLEDLLDADEVFLTNSLTGVCGVQRLGELELNEHEITEQVRKIYQDGNQ